MTKTVCSADKARAGRRIPKQTYSSDKYRKQGVLPITRVHDVCINKRRNSNGYMILAVTNRKSECVVNVEHKSPFSFLYVLFNVENKSRFSCMNVSSKSAKGETDFSFQLPRYRACSDVHKPRYRACPWTPPSLVVHSFFEPQQYSCGRRGKTPNAITTRDRQWHM